LLVGGVLAAGVAISDNAGVKDVVKKVVEEKGYDESKVQEVEEVNMEDLPDQVNLENIDDTNLAMYKVDMGEEKPVYVITVSDEKFKKTVKEVVSQKMLLNFGLPGEFSDSQFLNTATNVKTGYEKGYVMMHGGSVTGISTNADFLSDGGNLNIVLYLNGEEVGLRNSFDVKKEGILSDYDIQSQGVVNFEPGDILSVYASTEDGAEVKDVTTLVEIEIY